MFPRGNIPPRLSSPQQKSPGSSTARVFAYGADLSSMRFGSPPTPTTRVYPQLTTRISEPPPRAAESADARRDSDHFRKRPSMMSDFSFEGDVSKRPRLDTSPSMRRGYPNAQTVEIKKEPAYTPQVENISPTPDDQLSDKNKIIEQIKKLDQEIAVVETEIKRLKKQEKELTDRTNAEPCEKIEEVEEVVGQSLFERIYAENRKKAAASHAKLAGILGPPPTVLPLYYEPSEIPALIEQKKKYETFKPKLIMHLRKAQLARRARERVMSDRYNHMMQIWRKKVEKWENSQKRKLKEAKYREIFEKTFPELKKQREEKERDSRSRMETRSGLLTGRMEEREKEMAAEAHAEQEELDRQMRQSAVVPPILLESRNRCRYVYVDNNGLARDPMKEQQNRLSLFQILWSEEEKKIFKDKFMQYGKNFAAISVYLDKKTTSDCVQYYYLTKKRENFKQLLRRHYRRRGKPYKPPQMPRAGDLLHSKEEENHTEVTTEEIAEPECFCIICKTKIDGSNPGRVLTRACYEQYGLDSDAGVSNEIRICQKCRSAYVRKRFAQCPVGTCASTKRKVKPTRAMPPIWSEITAEQRQIVMSSLQILDDTQKFCSGCFKRITRKIETLLSDESQEPGALQVTPAKVELTTEWLEADVTLLAEGITKFGLDDWGKVAQMIIGKEADDCAKYYEKRKEDFTEAVNKAAAVAAAIKGVQGIEDEEEEERAESLKEGTIESVVETSLKTQNQGETPDCSSQKDEVADKTIKEDKADVFENVCDVKSSTNTTDNNDSDATVSADEGGIGDDMFTSNSDSQFMSIKSTERAMQRANDTRRGSIKPVSLPDCQALEQTSAKKTEPIVGSLTISSSSSIPTSYRKPKSDIASRVEREIEESRRLGAEVNKPIEVKTEMPSPIIIAPPKRLTEIEQPTVVAANDLNKSLSTSMTDSAEVTVLKTITKSPVTMPQRPPPLIRTPQESPHTNQPTTATNPLPNRMENAGIQKIPAGSITQGTPVRPPPPPSPLQLLTAQGGIMGRSPLSQPSPQSSGLLRSFQDPNMLMRPPTPAGTPISREEFLSRQPFMLEHMGREERPDMQGSSQQALISAAIFERHLNNARLEYMTAKQMGLSDEQAWMRYQQVLAVPAEIHSQQMLAEAAARQQDSNKQILADFLIAQQIQQHAEANKREREVASVQHQLQQQQQNQQSAIGDLARLGLDMSRLDSTLQAGLLSHHIYEQQQLEHRQQLLKQHQAIEQQRLIEQQQQRLLADRRVMEQRAVEAHMAVERQKAAAEQQRLTEYTRQLQQQQRMAAASNQLLSHGYLDPKLRLTANDILMRGELERNLSSLSRSPLQQYHQMGTHFLPAAQSPLPRNVMSTAAAGGHRFASTPPQPTPSPKNPLFDRTRVSPVILSPTAGGLSARGEHQLPLSQSQTPPAQLRTKGAMKMVTTKETQPVLSSLTEAQIKEYLNRPASPHTLSLPKGFEPRSAAGSLHHTQLHPSTSVNSPKTSAPPQSLVKAEAKQISRAESTLKVASPAQSAPAPTGVGHKAEVKSQIDGWLNDFIRRETAEPSGRIPSVVESLKERPETTSESSADKSCLSGLGKHIDDIIAEGFKSHQISASIQQQTTSVLTTSAGTAAPEKERKPTPPAFVYEFEPVSPPDGENVGEQSDVQQQTTPAWVAGAAKMNILRPDAGGSTAGTSPFQSAINVFDLKSPVRIQSGSQAANYPTTPGRQQQPPTLIESGKGQNTSVPLPAYEPLSDEEISTN